MEDQDHLDHQWKKRYAPLYRAQLSVLYHQKRERFFEIWDKVGKAVAVIGGSAAFASIGGPDLMRVVAAAITVTSTLSLVFGFSDRSKRHAELARNFRQLEAEIVAKGDRLFSDGDTDAWEAKVRMLESSEPPALGLLVVICQNELAIAHGQLKNVIPLPRWKQWLAQVFDFSVPPSIPPVTHN